MTNKEIRETLTKAYEDKNYQVHKHTLQDLFRQNFAKRGLEDGYREALERAVNRVSLSMLERDEVQHDAGLISLMRICSINWKSEVLAIQEWDKANS